MHFPKEQSNPISNLVAQINSQLGEAYLIVTYDNRRLYTLNLTGLALKSKKFSYIPTYELKYQEMFQYLCGILVGLRASEDKIS